MNNQGVKNRVAMFSIHSDPFAALGSQESGGQNIYVLDLVSNLDKQGWAVDVFTRLDDPRKKKVVKIGKNSRVIRLANGKSAYIHKGQLHPFFPEIYKRFLSFINYKNPYDVFHGHHYDGGWMALQAHKKFHRPFIQNFHSLGQVRLKTKKQYALDVSREKEIFDQRFAMEKDIIRAASLIISLAETERRDLSFLYGASLDKIVVIPGGVNIRRFLPRPKAKSRNILKLSKRDFILLFVGRLEWRKGIGTLISAVRLLKEIIPHVKVLIVGGKIFGSKKNKDDWKEYQRLLKKTKEEGVESQVRFVGRIDHNRLPIFYSSADVFVIPSYYEPFGLVALESMASQIPVVASRKGGLRITIKDDLTGLLFEPRNPKDLKEKILQIYQSKKLANFLVENAYDDILENYSWEHIAEEIGDIYKLFIKR